MHIVFITLVPFSSGKEKFTKHYLLILVQESLFCFWNTTLGLSANCVLSLCMSTGSGERSLLVSHHRKLKSTNWATVPPTFFLVLFRMFPVSGTYFIIEPSKLCWSHHHGCHSSHHIWTLPVVPFDAIVANHTGGRRVINAIQV